MLQLPTMESHRRLFEYLTIIQRIRLHLLDYKDRSISAEHRRQAFATIQETNYCIRILEYVQPHLANIDIPDQKLFATLTFG